MKVIRPTPITSAMLTSSNVPENDHPVWDAVTSWGMGALVISTVTHRIYSSTIPANVGHDPTAPGSTQWVDAGPTNRWAMFDQSVGTVTAGIGAIDVVLTPGVTDSLAVVDTDADSVTVTITAGGTQVYSVTQSTSIAGGVVDDWYSYFFTEVGKLTALTFMDLPIYAQAVISVAVTGVDPGGEVSVGTLIAGRVLNIGSTEAGASAGITDFSKKDTDDFGNTTIVQRGWSKTMECKALLPSGSVAGVQRALALLRATPALWIGEVGRDELTIYGFYKDFSLDIQYANISYCSLTVEGLT